MHVILFSIFLSTANTVICADIIDAVSRKINEDCEPPYCISLWEQDNPGVTWDQALLGCQKQNKTLLSITSKDAQNRAYNLVSNASGARPGIWIGGKMRELDVWKTLQGKIFGGDKIQFEDHRDKNCLVVINEDGQLVFSTEKCFDETTPRWIICQSEVANEGCSYTMNGICYKKKGFLGYSWYEAQESCKEDEVLVVEDFTSDFIKLLDDTHSAWIGYMRNPWYWLHNNELVTYFRWASSVLDQSGTHLCLLINTRGKWINADCKTMSTYYLCENNLWIILGSVCGAVLLVAVIIIVIFLLLRKRLSKPNDPDDPGVSRQLTTPDNYETVLDNQFSQPAGSSPTPAVTTNNAPEDKTTYADVTVSPDGAGDEFSPSAGGDTYAEVNKPQTRDTDDVMLDNTMYSAWGGQ